MYLESRYRMRNFEKNRGDGQGQSTSQAGKTCRAPRAAWYAGPYKDALIYLMVAIFFVELVVGGISFFYGVMHAAPDVPGGPPLARFPWLGWAVAAVLAPVGLMLIVHLSGTWVSRYLGREDGAPADNGEDFAADDEQVPERLRRFYAIIRNAPTVVLLLGIMLLCNSVSVCGNTPHILSKRCPPVFSRYFWRPCRLRTHMRLLQPRSCFRSGFERSRFPEPCTTPETA